MPRFVLAGGAAVLVITAACTGSGSGSNDSATTPRPLPHVTTLDASSPVVVGGEAGLPSPIEVPAGWSYVTADPGPHFAALVAATRPAVLQDVRDGSRFGPVTGRGLEPDDAFVEVHVTMPPPFGSRKTEPRFPRDLGVGHFEPGESFLGRASHAFYARGRNRIYYRIRYWIGPEADATTAETTLRLATSVRG